MAKTPSLSGKEIVSALKRAGFTVLRINGSHHFLRHTDGRRTVVPIHGNETIGVGLMSKILRDCEITVEQFGGWL